MKSFIVICKVFATIGGNSSCLSSVWFIKPALGAAEKGYRNAILLFIAVNAIAKTTTTRETTEASTTTSCHTNCMLIARPSNSGRPTRLASCSSSLLLLLLLLWQLPQERPPNWLPLLPQRRCQAFMIVFRCLIYGVWLTNLNSGVLKFL